MLDPIPACHVVAVPYPGRGHVNPMINLCKLLADSTPPNNRLLMITVILTEEWLGLIADDQKLTPNVRFATIPTVLLPESDRAADMPGFVEGTQTKMEEPFEKLVDGLGMPVHFLIADTFLNWAVDFGNRRNIPVASLWTLPASVFSVFYHFDLLVENGHHPAELSERGDERVEYIPGIQNSIRLADIHAVAHMKDRRLLRLCLNVFSNVSRAQYLLFTTIYEVESHALQSLRQQFPFPLYTFGPAIPYSNLQNSTKSPSSIIENGDPYFDWLDAQPQSSVLYVSLGSFLSVSSAQMDEIADGLRDNGVRFLWVARGEAERLQKLCGDSGRVVAWCQQLKVLCHSCIGGFWTHCGWNSTMEAIYCGVPMIAFPVALDQMTIRKHIVEDWKIGWDARKGGRDGTLLRSKEIAAVVKECMDLGSKERKQIEARAKALKKAAREAISQGGSSMTNLASFLNDILSFGP